MRALTLEAACCCTALNKGIDLFHFFFQHFSTSLGLDHKTARSNNDYLSLALVHLKTGWLEAHFIGFIGKKRKELSN